MAPITWQEIQKELSKDMNMNFLTRKEGLKLIRVVEKLKDWCHLQDKVIKDLHRKLEDARNSK